jgi:outer membrane protein TolC
VNLVRVEDAVLQQRIAAYQQQVLLANEEAENAIVGFLQYHEAVKSLLTSVKAAQEAERVSNEQYLGGKDAYNQLFTIQTLVLTQQDALATAQGQSAQSVVELYRALGGGWQIRLGEPPESYPQPEFVAPPAPHPAENVPAPPPVPPQPLQP